MPVTIVVGAQYGGEGKGKIVAHLAKRDNPDFVVRCGGPNSGHTVYVGDQVFKLRLLPAGFVNPRSRLLLAAGCILDLNLLLHEIEITGTDIRRVGIDRNAMILSAEDGTRESQRDLRNRIGSTLSGTGNAVARRVLRDSSVKLASDIPEARMLLTDVSLEINSGIDKGQLCIIEGTQGFGLSLYHTQCYPYATSRDTTASAFLSEVGLSPLKVDSIIMAIRTFPIRVEGNSGLLKHEITWEELQKRSGYPYPINEYTTVTGRLRRVAGFDFELVRRAAMVNRPTELALHGVDYLDYSNKSITNFELITSSAKDFIKRVESDLGVPIILIGTGPEQYEIVDRALDETKIAFAGRSELKDA
ncbi:MAG TPA: adenylosuccinate synthetase [Dehalococcoidales bacterium]